MQVQDTPSQNPQTALQEKVSPAPIKQIRLGKIVVIGIIVFILISLPTGIFILSQQKNSTGKNAKKTFADSPLNNPLVQKLAEKLPIPKITLVPITLAPTETLSNDPTPQQTNSPAYLPKDWNKYNNTTFNFSIDYPVGFRTKENSLGLGVADISFVNSDNNKAIYQILIYPKTIGKLIGLDFDMLYILPVPSIQRMTTGKNSQLFTKTGSKTISGLRAFEFKSTSDPPDPNIDAEIGAYIEIGESTLIISTAESNQTILDHMLSTFKYSSN